MTIRELQYAIQHAIDETPGVTDDCTVGTKLDEHGKRRFYAIVPGRDKNGLNPSLDKWIELN